ncbi:MAG: DUF393 domain-containing protein [Sumerlaeia bacterium]
MTSAPRATLPKPIALFDGHCAICRDLKKAVEDADRRHRIEWLELHDPAVRARFPRVDWARATREIHLIERDGRIRTGGAAIREIVRVVGGNVGGGLATLLALPGLKQGGDLAYRLFSDNRHWIGRVIKGGDDCGCGGDSCAVS